MTSEEKLAKIMAMRALRRILSQCSGTMNLFEMMHLFQSQSDMDLSSGEFDVFEKLKAALKAQDSRKPEGKLEAEMQQIDKFKELLSQQFDKLIKEMVLELAG